MKNNNFKINKLLLMVIFFLSCNLDKEIPSSDSIYNYSEEILGDPISIIISESEKIIYEIKSDKLLDSLGNIILIGGVAIEVFDDVGIKINDIFSIVNKFKRNKMIGGAKREPPIPYLPRF